jgi:type IV pilus assembly protein PilM
VKKNLISIDIGLNLTKVLEAELDKGTLVVQKLDVFTTPYKDNEIVGKIFFEQLYKIIPLARFKNSSIAISVPSTSINFSILELPKMPNEDLGKVVPREAKRRILPAPLAEDIFKYTVLAEKKIKKATQLEILAGAGSRNVITKYLSLFKHDGVIPDSIISTPLALIKYFSEYKPSPEENWALIDIGLKNTSMLIFTKSDVALIRNIPFASFDFIESIRKKMGVSFEKAEELFLREELISEESVVGSWQYLLTELRRSFAYYKEISGGQRIDSIMFSGGMFKLSKPFDFLRKNMGGHLEVFKFTSLKNISVGKSISKDVLSSGPVFATVLGLALNLRSLRKEILNFLPLEIYRERKLKEIKSLFLRVLAAIAVSLILLIIGAGVKMRLSSTEVDVLTKAFSESEHKKFTKMASEINLKKSNLKKQKDLIIKISKEQLSWQELFGVLSSSIPDETFLKELLVEEQQATKEEVKLQQPVDSVPDKKQRLPQPKSHISVKIKAAIFGDYELAKITADDFYKNLMDSGLFFSVNLDPPKLEGIVISAIGEQTALTQLREREFNIEAKIAIK